MTVKNQESRQSEGHLRLQTFGGARLLSVAPEGDEVELLGAGKPLALITYLACSPGREVSRPRLVDLLWSDLEPEAARHALRQTLWHIRRRVVDDLITTSADAVALSRSLEFDRDALLAALELRDDEQVVGLYSGEFFPAFAAPGGAGFEQWADVERGRLQQVFAASAHALVRRWLNQSRFREAQDLARRLRDCDLDDQAGWRLLIESYLSSGDRLRARLEVEELLARSERDEFELEASTRSMMRSAQSEGSPSPSAGEPPVESRDIPEPALVGRETEFSRILSEWHAASGQGRVRRLSLVAPAGLGKSRLLRDVSSRLRALRARVASARGSVSHRELPYALASDVAGALARLPGARAISPQSASILVGLNPTLSSHFDVAPRSPLGDEALRQRALALQELLHAVCDEHPVALLIDDLHYSDEASYRLLGLILAELPPARLLVVFASRPDPRLGQLQPWSDGVIELMGLTATEIGHLLGSIASLPEDSWAQQLPARLHNLSGGSPLLALEAISNLLERGVLARAGDAWQCPAPTRLLEVLRDGSPLRTRVERLERSERWILTVAAAARRPLSREAIAGADDRSPDAVQGSLLELERRGLLQRVGDEWMVSHDEIADAALDLAGVDARRAALVSAGRAILAGSPFDDRAAQVAATLFANAGATAELSRLFHTFAQRAFVRGERRGLARLARDLAGTAAADGMIRQMVHSTPWRWRVGLVSRTRTTLATFGVLALATGLWASQNSATAVPADAVLGYVTTDSVGIVVHQVDLRESQWQDSMPLFARPGPAELRIPGHDLAGVSATASPTGRGLTLSLAVDDSGVIDLFDAEPGHPLRRLTYTPGDDISSDLSPDGLSLVFSTARWNPKSHYDIALMDLATGAVQQLTSGQASDVDPRWSPDGTHVAFIRRRWADGPTQICVWSTAGDPMRCYDEPDQNGLGGWLDGTTLLVTAVSGDASRLLQMNAATGESRPFDVDWPAGVARVSPDGRWVFCFCDVHGSHEPALVVFPSDRPRRYRELVLPGQHPFLTLGWLNFSRAALARTARIASGWDHPQVGVPHVLRAAALDSLGRVVPGAIVRWSLADSSAATIDSRRGVFVGGKPGPATVHASPNRALGATRLLTVVPAMAESLWTEEWNDSSLTSWYRIGWPDSRVVTLPNGAHWFFNNGDGSFESGVVSRQTFETRSGLAVELTVSMPVTDRQWQQLNLGLLSEVDPTKFERARGHNAVPSPRGLENLCVVGWPGENAASTSARRDVAMANAAGQLSRPLDHRYLTGRQVSVRLQLFPDGRCGVAFDGQAFLVTPEPTAWHDRANLRIGGNSKGTTILVGPVRVFRGVLPGIDWSKAEVRQ